MKNISGFSWVCNLVWYLVGWIRIGSSSEYVFSFVFAFIIWFWYVIFGVIFHYLASFIKLQLKTRNSRVLRVYNVRLLNKLYQLGNVFITPVFSTWSTEIFMLNLLRSRDLWFSFRKYLNDPCGQTWNDLFIYRSCMYIVGFPYKNDLVHHLYFSQMYINNYVIDYIYVLICIWVQ